MAFSTPREVVASAARTSTGTSGTLTLGELGEDISLLVDVSAVSGTGPTLDLTVEWSHDGGTTWATADPADAFAQITAAGAKVKAFAVKAPAYRLRWTIGGTTPSFTFSLREYVTG
jgi:hypothetical protein